MPISYPVQNQYGSSNPYFDLNNLYGAKKNYSTIDMIANPAGYLEKNPQALWTRFTSPFAGGEDAFSKFVQGRQDEVWNAYEAALATNPQLTRQHFLQGFGPQYFRNQFNQLGEQQRGINSGLYRGRARWVSNG